MPRYEKVTSNVLYQPARLTLNSAAHRASLDGSDVAVLSGVDPGTEGTLRRMPGGRVIYNLGLTNGQYRTVDRMQACDRVGVSGAWFQRTVSTAAETMNSDGSAETVEVAYGLGFRVGDVVAMFDPENASAKCCLAYVSAVTKGALTLYVSQYDGNSGGAEIWLWGSGGAYIQQAVLCEHVHPSDGDGPYTITIAADTGFTVFHPGGLTPGMKVFVAANASPTTPDTRYASAKTVVSVTKNAGAYWTVKLDSAVTISVDSSGVAVSVALVAHRFGISVAGVESISGQKVFLTTGSMDWTEFDGSGSGDYDWRGTQFSSEDHNIRMTPVGSRYFVTDGKSPPFQLLLESTQTKASGQRLSCCRVGSESIRAAGGSAFTTAASGGYISSGSHRAFLRFVDKRAVPYGYSDPIYTQEFTSDGDYALSLNPTTLFQYADEDYSRYTHYEIWLTRASGDDYYRVYEGSTQNLLANRGTTPWLTGMEPPAGIYPLASLSDEELLFQTLLSTSARDKYLPPLCKFIHYREGICFYGGKPSTVPTTDETGFITSDSILWFSRTDADEPENVPTENFKIVSGSLGRLHGFCDARDSTLALFDSGYVVIRRLGTYLTFAEDATHGCGCAQDDAFISSRTHAIWWGSEGIWVYDPASMDAPINLGKPIRDWVRDINTQIAADANIVVSLGMDPEHGVLYVNVTNGDTVAEGMVYSFGSTPSGFDWSAGTWCKREDWPVEAMAFCRGVTTGLGYELIAGQKDSLLITADWTNRPIAHGWASINGTDKITGVLEGSCSAGDVTDLAGGSPHLHLTNTVAFTTTDSLKGACVSFWRVDTAAETVTLVGRRVIKSISGATATQVDLTSSITVLAGDRWIIGGVPWKVRFPPIRGEDPFVRKLANGGQLILGDIYTDAASAGTQHKLWVHALDNLNTTPRTGNADSLALPVSGYKRGAIDVRAAGEILEVEVFNYTGHFRADLLYCGVPVSSEGVFKSQAV